MTKQRLADIACRNYGPFGDLPPWAICWNDVFLLPRLNGNRESTSLLDLCPHVVIVVFVCVFCFFFSCSPVLPGSPLSGRSITCWMLCFCPGGEGVGFHIKGWKGFAIMVD